MTKKKKTTGKSPAQKMLDYARVVQNKRMQNDKGETWHEMGYGELAAGARDNIGKALANLMTMNTEVAEESFADAANYCAMCIDVIKKSKLPK